MKLNKLFAVVALSLVALFTTGCGTKVEVPPAHVGKVMTKNGYQDSLIPTSTFRLPACWAYCDKLVILDTSDKTKVEKLNIFMPTDKLNLDVNIQTTLSVNPKKTNELFATLPPSAGANESVATISWDTIYKTYAAQIVQTEVREYLSKYSIAEVSSSMEKVNSDLRVALTKAISSRTPYTVRYVGITSIKYPKIITDAQENAATRREMIQQEEAQLQISKVKLERELQETRLSRQIELEKAQIEATSQRIQREVVDDKVLALRKLENERAWIEAWDGKLPGVVSNADGMILSVPGK